MKNVSIALIFLLIISSVIVEYTVSQDILPRYEKGNKRNPFIPVITNDGQLINIQDEVEKDNLSLEGIIYDEEGQSMAIINGQILRKNDTIGDAKIVEIRKDGVVYAKDGEIFLLNAEKEE